LWSHFSMSREGCLSELAAELVHKQYEMLPGAPLYKVVGSVIDDAADAFAALVWYETHGAFLYRDRAFERRLSKAQWPSRDTPEALAADGVDNSYDPAPAAFKCDLAVARFQRIVRRAERGDDLAEVAGELLTEQRDGLEKRTRSYRRGVNKLPRPEHVRRLRVVTQLVPGLLPAPMQRHTGRGIRTQHDQWTLLMMSAHGAKATTIAKKLQTEGARALASCFGETVQPLSRRQVWRTRKIVLEHLAEQLAPLMPDIAAAA
jgi:hypothetical protein